MALSDTKTQRISNWSHGILEAWASLHVEFQGCYSSQRLVQLQSYSADLSSLRLVIICLLTPLPCLFLSLLSDVVPLPPMEAGVSSNWFVFVRSGALTGLIGAGVLVQIGQGVVQLKMSTRQVVFIALLAATVSMIFVALLCSLIVFPMPFGTLLAGPPCVFVIGAGVIYVSLPRLRADPSLWTELQRQLDVFHSMTALTFIYPLYIYGYTSLTGFGQLAFALLSPVIQIIAKNRISRKLTGHDYMKPEAVVFFVDLFNALYSSSVLQGTSSWKTTVLIIDTDILQFGLAIFDMMKLLDEMNGMMKKIPREHPLAHANFVQIAARLVNIETKLELSQLKYNYSPGSSTTWQKTMKAGVRSTNKPKTESSPSRESTMQIKTDPPAGKTRGSKWIISHKARVFPIRPPQFNTWSKLNFQPSETTATNELSLGIEAIFSSKERALFIQKGLHVLFVTEYVVLGEYVEVAMPIIFNLHQLALFHMSNSAHYPSLAGKSSAQFYPEVYYGVTYAGLEFLTMVMAIKVLKRLLGFSPLCQLAFVLEKQAGTIQMKLIGVFVYIMQLSLKHVGADFSFKFSWLHSPKNAS